MVTKPQQSCHNGPVSLFRAIKLLLLFDSDKFFSKKVMEEEGDEILDKHWTQDNRTKF